MPTSSKLSLDKEGWREAPRGGLIGGRLPTPPPRGTTPHRGGDNYPCCSPNCSPPPSASPRRAAALRKSTRSRNACGDSMRPKSRWAWRTSAATRVRAGSASRSEEHTSELQSRFDLVCRLLLEKKKQ